MPGGIALSVNSVGHMAKSGALAKAYRDMEVEIGAPRDGPAPTKIDSLAQALEFAMRTIDMAADTISGPATRLVEAPPAARCPIKLPINLAGHDCHEYEGFYHTDITLPSAYFRPEIERPSATKLWRLDFTYLWKSGVDNPDHTTMGGGRNIRSATLLSKTGEDRHAHGPALRKSLRMQPTQIAIHSSPRLVAALGGTHK